MAKLGFIGLGLMGNPMSKNLIKAGHQVTVWNRTASRIDDVVAAGANAAAFPRQVAELSEITITMVTDSVAVEEVILGEGGVIEGAAPGSVVIDMSTISPRVTRAIARKLGEKGVHMMDAPVSGGVGGASRGALSIMVGGDRAVLDRCRHVYEAMGERITYCGDAGMGQVTKLANQITVLGNLAAACEALVFAAKAGADLRATLRALTGGTGNSYILENLAPRILDGDFKAGFKIELSEKDLRLVLEAAGEMGLPLFTTPIVSQTFRSAKQSGSAGEGIQAYVKVLEKLAGVEARWPGDRLSGEGE
jgi:3-hydroxyisobutyrate dehydrogenase